jgi:MoaA/NifB/PqqE/SkfB family radical SAM enzyme
MFDKLCRSGTLTRVGYIAAHTLPSFRTLKKYRNLLLAAYSANRRLPIIRNNPVVVRLAPAAVCNYRCLFCEVHKDDVLFPNRSQNLMTLEDVKNYESFLSTAYSVWFYGGSAEPLLSPHFGEIAKYLKSKYNMKLSVNTNGSPLSHALCDALVDSGFDYILLSYHAATREMYKHLMTGDVERVDKNIEYLNRRKAEKHAKKPVVDLSIALHRMNAQEALPVLDKAKTFHVRAVNVSKYYGGRNKLQDKDVSFEYDVEAGNKLLDEIYTYGKQQGIRVLPKTPCYWLARPAAMAWNPENYNRSGECLHPWTRLDFDPVLDEENCHYVCVCNRISLFKIRYRECKVDSPERFDKLWNHPLLQYMRTTVNGDGLNPMCIFCRNYDLGTLRNLDAAKYAELRDTAVRSFFEEFRSKYQYEEIRGLEVLRENPYSEESFQQRLTSRKFYKRSSG